MRIDQNERHRVSRVRRVRLTGLRVQHQFGIPMVCRDRQDAPLLADLSIDSSQAGIHGFHRLDGGGHVSRVSHHVGVGKIDHHGGKDAAFQLFDQKTKHLLRDEYDIPQVSKVEANTIEALADGLGVDRDGLVKTVSEFNSAVQPGEYNPTALDGKGTEGIEPPKTNWALPVDSPPYMGFAVTCGITFTFGGLKIDSEGRVQDTEDAPIPGLYAAGELVGGLFYHNYPGGSGLMAGSVFGKIAEEGAATHANSLK